MRLSPRAGAALLLALPAATLALFFAYPLAATLREALGAPDAWAWLASPYVLDRVRIALLQATLSAALTIALALPLAWHHHARAIPLSRLQLALHAAPFVLPVFVVVYGIQGLLGPHGALATLTGLDLLGVLGPLGAVVLANAYYNYGFAARLLHATLARRPHRLEEAARTLGASPRAALARVTLPLLAPALAAAALLAFLFSFASFGVVLLLGQGQVATLETMMYQNLGGAFPSPDRAAALGALQLGLNVLLFGAYAWLQRRAARRLPAAPERAPAPARRRDIVLAGAALALALAPALAVLAGGFRVRGEWTLEPWRILLDTTHPRHLAGFSLPHALGLSLLYALAATVLSVLLALALAYGARRLGGPLRVLVDTLATLPLGTSSLLLGFGYVLAFGAGSWLDLRGTTGVIVVAHTLVAFPFTARVLLPAIEGHDARLDEAAALLGASPRQTLLRVHLPLLAAPLAVAAGLAAAISLGDFGASLLLMRPDNMSLAVWVARHDRPFDPLLKAQAHALAGLLALLAAGVVLALERAYAAQERRSR